MTIESTKRIRSDMTTDVERPWISAVLGLGKGVVWEQLVERGVNPALAGNIAEWLDAQAHGRRNCTPQSRVKYRKVLGDLTPIMFVYLSMQRTA